MAEKFDDGKFWLPSEFLTDDELFEDLKTVSFRKKRDHDFSFGFWNSLPFSSDLGSPVESVGGSTETESDEDDFIAGLARKITNSTLRQSNFCFDDTTNGWSVSGMCEPKSVWGIPNCASPESSPPELIEPVGWDSLYAAAGEIARMRMIDETAAFYSTKLFAPTQKPSPITVPLQKPNTAGGFYPNHSEGFIAYRQLQARQLQLLNQQQMMRRVLGQRKMGYEFQNERRNEAGRTRSLPMATWPTLQQSQQLKQQPGSGMRAVFLGETGAKKERTGTGVFIPRGSLTNPTETTRKKPGCSVLLPDRVVRALNSNLESKLTPNHNTEYDAALKRRNIAIMAQQRRNLRPKQPLTNQELRLPQDWTY